MPKLRLDEIKYIYEFLKKEIVDNIKKKDFHKALVNIEVSAKIASNFNWIYSDEELEDNLKKISQNLVGNPKFIPKKNNVIFYDSWGVDNRGLTLQYIRALNNLNYNILYLFENEDWNQSTFLRKEIECKKNIKIINVQNRNKLSKIKNLCQFITEFAPDKLFMHINPWAVEPLTVFFALENVTKYQINLTDHAFWLGVKCLDFCIEFRDYGYTVSLEKRNIKHEQLYVNPYYPIITNDNYSTTQVKKNNMVYILCGGSYYKIYGRKKAFFKIILTLLSQYPEIIILYAGGGDGRTLRKFILDNSLSQRFITLGSRKDIGAVFDVCDIYLSTYPITGGLMSQIAASKSKPILSYTNSELKFNFLEDLLNYNDNFTVTYTKLDDFYDHAKRLIKDSLYRYNCGKKINASMITSEQFNLSVFNLLNNNVKNNFSKICINYSVITDLYLEVENEYQDQFKRLFLKHFGSKSIILFPIIFIKCMPALFRVLISRSRKISYIR